MDGSSRVAALGCGVTFARSLEQLLGGKDGCVMTTAEPALDTYVGREAEPPRVARYPVNQAMIVNWAEALGDANPIYVDPEAARATGRSDVICPPAMISTWVMSGYKRFRAVQEMRRTGQAEDAAYFRLMAQLDRAGYTSVVATNVEQTYHRELHPGDHVTTTFLIEAVSELKRTGLGEGHFITLLKHYRTGASELIAEERFRLLRFRPAATEEVAK